MMHSMTRISILLLTVLPAFVIGEDKKFLRVRLVEIFHITNLVPSLQQIY